MIITDGNTVVIDVEARFTDSMSAGMGKAQQQADRFEKSMKNTQKQLDRFGHTRSRASLGVDDHATPGIRRALSSAAQFTGRAFRGTLNVIDRASNKIEYAENLGRNFGRRTWNATIGIVDKATAPLRFIKNQLFSIQTLIAGVATGMAAQQFVGGPIALADNIETARIGFETMLGGIDKADKMMADIKQFAIETPFETMDIVQNTQRMLAMNWDPKTVLSDMEKIGNASAAVGQGAQGIERVTLALGQMKMKGKVSAEEMLQLTEGGIKGWDYLAKGIGKTVAETQEMVTDGLVPVDEAIRHIINGMSEFDGMMTKTANRTVTGLKSQIKDTFEAGIIEKWGKGLQKGTIKGLEKFLAYLDKTSPKIEKWGIALEDLGEELSTKVVYGLEKVGKRADEAFNSDEFQNAGSAFERISIAWDKIIAEPFSDWWDTKGKQVFADKAASFGEGLGTGISSGLMAILGFDAAGAADDGASIGASFGKGFAEGFDGEGVGNAIKGALKRALGSAADILPGGEKASAGSWISAGLLAFGGSKLLKGAGGLVKGGKGAWDFLTKARGAGAAAGAAGAGGAAAGGMSLLQSAGFKLGTLGRGLGSQATGLRLVGVGAGAAAGGIAGGAGVISGVNDLVNKEYDRGGTKLGLVGSGAAAGAAIGFVVPVVGTAAGALIGAGVGGVGALWKGDEWGDKLGAWFSDHFGSKEARSQTWESVKDWAMPKEKREEYAQGWAKTKESVGNWWSNTKQSASEGWQNTKQGVSDWWGNTKQRASEGWQNTKQGAADTWQGAKDWGADVAEYWKGKADEIKEFFSAENIGEMLGTAVGTAEAFFFETLPEKWDSFIEGTSSFFTETLPEKWDGFIESASSFFTETIPEKWNGFVDGASSLFTETIPEKWGNFVDTTKENFATKVQEWKDGWEDTKATWGNKVQEWKDGWETTKATWGSKVDEWKQGWETTKATWSSKVDEWKNSWSETKATWSAKAEEWKNGWGEVKSAFSSAAESLGNWADKAKTGLKSAYENAKTKVSGWWDDFSSGFSKGRKEANPANNANGSFVGSKTLSWLAEDGPEVVIPLGGHRRRRGLELWEKAGQVLGVAQHANGGFVGAPAKPQPTIPAPATIGGAGNIAAPSASSGVNVQIGNITITVSGVAGNLLESINSQRGEIADAISEIVSEALSEAFENMPLAAT